MKFNLGCGRRKLPGYVNVDAWPGCEPDQVVDLERTPWPWPDDCAEEILFTHSLEHMGQAPAVFLSIMSEVYRIAAPDCRVAIRVPHPRSDAFVSDPTHVRPITGDTLRLFDRALNAEWADKANTPLGEMLGVDFVLEHEETVLAEPFRSRLKCGELSDAGARELLATAYNVASELRFVLRVRKGQ